MKKLIAFLKSIFCKEQDHTDNTKQTDWAETNESEDSYVYGPSSIDPETNDGDMDDSIAVTDESVCDEDCECCDCNEESSDEDECTCEECECTEGNCICDEECECECCDCDKEPSDECKCDEACECAVVVESKEELVSDQLDTWGISKDTLGYNAIMAMIDVNGVLTYDEIAAEIAVKLDKSKSAISNSLKALVTKANFEASLYYAIKDINKEDNFKAIVETIYFWISKVL